MAWVRSLRTDGGISAHERHRASGQPKVGNLLLRSRMMLAPIRSIASTMERDLGEEEFSGQPALGQVRRDSLLGPFRWNLRIEEYEHRRPRSAEGGSEDAGISGEFLERGKQRRERRPIRLMNAVLESRGEQVRTILRKRSEQQHRVLNIRNRVSARVLERQHAAS